MQSENNKLLGKTRIRVLRSAFTLQQHFEPEPGSMQVRDETANRGSVFSRADVMVVAAAVFVVVVMLMYRIMIMRSFAASVCVLDRRGAEPVAEHDKAQN